MRGSVPLMRELGECEMRGSVPLMRELGECEMRGSMPLTLEEKVRGVRIEEFRALKNKELGECEMRRGQKGSKDLMDYVDTSSQVVKGGGIHGLLVVPGQLCP